MLDKLKNLLGMGWGNPVSRTAAQAGLVILVAAGSGWVDVEVWKNAVLAAGAALFAATQAKLRGDG